MRSSTAGGWVVAVIAAAMAADHIGFAQTGPPIQATSYVVPLVPGVSTQSLLTVGDSVGGYRMAGIPDGLGAFDNGDGTFTLLMNHELGETSGVPRLHGGTGSFVSEWIIKKDTLEVLSGRDLASILVLNGSTSLNLGRFCSADLPPVTAFYNAASGKGTTDRIFMNGEEIAGGRAVGHIASGLLVGTSFELPLLGKFAHENSLANPFAQDKTVVASTDDTTPQAAGNPSNDGGRVYIYVGTKSATGSPVDKAGLTNGVNYAIQVSVQGLDVNLESRSFGLASAGPGVTAAGTFTLAASGGTQFQRPEDGAWDPSHPEDFYFVTTDRLDQIRDGGIQVGRSRLWRLHFTDIADPTPGGTIEMLLKGTEGGTMFDNIAIDRHGRIVLLEDVGNAPHNGKIWLYQIASGQLTMIAQHDPARFGDVGREATSPFNRDEESSGVIDVSDILGEGAFLLDVQSHYPINSSSPNGFSNPNELVEGGQLLLMRVPLTTGN